MKALGLARLRNAPAAQLSSFLGKCRLTGICLKQNLNRPQPLLLSCEQVQLDLTFGQWPPHCQSSSMSTPARQASGGFGRMA